jgi:aminopeptidase N
LKNRNKFLIIFPKTLIRFSEGDLMKLIGTILIILTGIITYPQGKSNNIECYLNKISSVPAGIEAGAPGHSYDVLNYKLNLDLYHCYVPPYPKSFTAAEEIHFRVDSALSSIQLNAVNDYLQIVSVGLAGISFNHTQNILTITLDAVYHPGDTVTVLINFIHANTFDNAFFTANGFVFTNTPPEGSRNWFPCWDKPSDKATLDLTAKVPANVKLGSNGLLQDSVLTGDTIYYRWVSRDPIATYLMVISSKVNYNLDIDYWINANTNDTIPIRYYWNQGENQANLQNIRNQMLPMMTHFSDLFGDYPFEKNGFATLNSHFPFAGMENQTLISLCPNCWDEILIAHEFAHQWFGDMISPATWADVWLNEGFASYCEPLWYEFTSGYTAYKTAVVGHATAYFNGNPGFPIYNPSWAVTTPPLNTLYNYAIIYAKGSAVLHMLRTVLGDSVFFSALKAYATDPSLKHYNAYTSDLVTVFNQISGQDLNWFFDQWVYGPNHPVYQNTYEIDSTGSGQWKVSLLIKQVQTNAPFFKMPVKIRINYFEGADSLFTIFSESDNQLFEFFSSRKPEALFFDPDNDIVLKKGATTIVSVEDKQEILLDYNLYQNFPNPFNPETLISADIPSQSKVKLTIYNLMGETIHTSEHNNVQAGKYEYKWKAGNYSSGVYIYRFEADPLNGERTFSSTRKMILLK